MDDENDWEDEEEVLVLAESTNSHLELIPGSNPPEYVRQCDHGNSSMSMEKDIFAHHGSTVFDQWSEAEEESESIQKSQHVHGEPFKHSSKIPRVPNILSMSLHHDLSIGAPRPWSLSCTPSPFSSLRRLRDLDLFHRSVLYRKFKQTHMIPQAYGKGECFAVHYSDNGKHLIAAYENGDIDVIHGQTETLRHITESHGSSVNSLCWTGETTFASGCDSGVVNLWDIRLLTRPTQSVYICQGYTDEDPALLCEELRHDRHIKDLIFVPATEKNGAYLAVSTFSTYIHTVSLCGDLITGTKMTRVSQLGNNRMVLIPSGVPYAATLLLAFQTAYPARLASVSPGWKDRTSLSLDSSVFSVNWRKLSYREDVTVLHHRYESCEPYRSLTLDPLGGGVVIGSTRHRSKWVGRTVVSAVTYYDFASTPDNPVVLNGVTPRFFMPQKASDEVLQQPAFAPNGCFLAAPQDRRVDILTSGQWAEPFRESGGGMRQFHRAAVLRIPKCGDMLCCAVSPWDNLTVASGCTLGHVHFAQPNF